LEKKKLEQDAGHVPSPVTALLQVNEHAVSLILLIWIAAAAKLARPVPMTVTGIGRKETDRQCSLVPGSLHLRGSFRFSL
jgi:hypothetical protein